MSISNNPSKVHGQGAKLFRALQALPEAEQRAFWSLVSLEDAWVDTPLGEWLPDLIQHSVDEYLEAGEFVLNGNRSHQARIINHLLGCIAKRLLRAQVMQSKPNPRNVERNHRILKLRDSGKTYGQIAAILKRENPEWTLTYKAVAQIARRSKDKLDNGK